jgi:tRNA (guanine37-N1)-methyltransferase
MVMQVQPVMDAFRANGFGGEVIYMSPRGEMLSQELAEELANKDELTIICGHYEGIDQRALDSLQAREVSIGDYVLTGGELPALVFIDALSRMAPGVLSNNECFTEESHYSGLLEYPQYTKPQVWRGLKVPPVLYSGDHQKVDRWRREHSLINTAKKRPDMLKNRELSAGDKNIIESVLGEKTE